MTLRARQTLIVFPLAVVSALALGSIVMGVGCIPDPKGDFEEFGVNTESQRTKPRDAAAFEGSAPRDSIKRAFLAVCMSSLSSGRPDKTLRFYADVDYKPTDSGGTLELDLLPVKSVSESFDKSSGVAPNTKFASVQVQSSGAFAATAAVVNVDGAANGISGRPIVIEGVTLDGAIKTGGFCARFAGQVTAPIQQAFTADCLFLPLENNAKFVSGLIEFEYPGANGTTNKLVRKDFETCNIL